MLVRTFRLWSVAHDAEARARQWTASYPPSSSSVTSRTRVRTSVAVGEVTASFFFFWRSLIYLSAEMSATNEANKKN